MKKNVSYLVGSLVFVCFVFISCKKQISSGLPDNLITTRPDSVLIAKLTASFKEGESVVKKYPVLFDSIHEKRIILRQDAFVYVTFLEGDALWTNSLGYYTYLISDPPSIANKRIIFPNISGVRDGSALKPGDMVQIGDGIIPKGTVIGLYLVAKGWNGSKGKVVDGIYTNYTDRIFNINKYQQSIIYVDKSTGKLVLGFKDMLLNNPDNDFDYNDIVVSVSDSKDPTVAPTSFDLTSIPIL